MKKEQTENTRTITWIWVHRYCTQNICQKNNVGARGGDRGRRSNTIRRRVRNGRQLVPLIAAVASKQPLFCLRKNILSIHVHMWEQTSKTVDVHKCTCVFLLFCASPTGILGILSVNLTAACKTHPQHPRVYICRSKHRKTCVLPLLCALPTGIVGIDRVYVLSLTITDEKWSPRSLSPLKACHRAHQYRHRHQGIVMCARTHTRNAAWCTDIAWGLPYEWSKRKLYACVLSI